jgi:hypothetical protein
MRAAFICSNPDCRCQTVAPASEDEERCVFLGKAAHIAAASAGGPRYVPTMSPQQRSAITNAIFLCSNCADLVDKNGGMDFPAELLITWKTEHESWVASNLNKRSAGIGGDGGGGTIIGDRGTIVAGRGGDAGLSGRGGNGGSGFIQGDDGLIIGGDGGSGATSDGRGGRGALGPTERFGFSTAVWGFGRGGSGHNAPEFDRRVALISKYRVEYKQKFPERAPYIDAGIDPVPIDWINQRLVEEGEQWAVMCGPQGYLLPSLG